MKKIIVLSFLCASILNIQHINSQQIFAEIGRVDSKFIYADSKGESKLDLFPSKDFSYALGYRKELSPVFYLNGAVIFNRYGAFGSDEYKNNFSWDVFYIGFSASLDYEFYQKKAFRFYTKLAFEPQFLASGNQIINGETFDLKGVEQFDSPFTFLRGGVGVNWCSNSKIAISAKYMFGRTIFGSNNENEEDLKIQTNTLNLGLIWSIKKCKYCQTNRFNKKNNR